MINRNRLIDNFKQLVELDSVSFQERATADWLLVYLRRLGFTVEEDQAGDSFGGNAGNIYGFLKGTLPGGPILFSSHMDVVQPGIGKKAVFGPDGTITSDGTTVLGADDIAGIVEILEGIQVLQEKNIPHRDVEVVFPIGEETYIKGTNQFDFSKVHAEQAYVLDLSGPVGTAANQAPSIISFEIVVHGVASHAGFAPEAGTNAIALMCDAISKIQQGHIDEETTLNIGTIQGGAATNIVSDKAVCRGEIRSFHHEKALECLDILQQVLGETTRDTKGTFTITSEVHMKAYRIEEADNVVVQFRKACEKLGLKGEIVSTFGGSDNNNFVAKGIPGIVLSCGMYNVHSTFEYTTIKDLRDGAKLVAQLLSQTN